VVNLISLLAAPIIVRYSSNTTAELIVAAVLAAVVIWAITQSKKHAPELAAQPVEEKK
jgi:hypothetical protein